jgi:two-component system, LuxR family, response regulator DctR
MSNSTKVIDNTFSPMRPPASLPANVFIVEDDDVLADALAFMLSSRHLSSQRFASGEAFLSWLPQWQNSPACILLDVRMKRLSGIEVFDLLRETVNVDVLPVIFLTGHGDIDMAVNAVKNGAFDFFEKPFSDNRLADRVIEGVEESKRRILKVGSSANVAQLLQRLSNREQDVMRLILKGKLNKVIAGDLGISMRTVEVHRANIFTKMRVRSAVELARALEGITF